MCIEILLEEQKKKEAKSEQKAEEKAKEGQPQVTQNPQPEKCDEEKDDQRNLTQAPPHEEAGNKMKKEKAEEQFQMVMRPETLEKWKAEDYAIHKMELSAKGVYKITASAKETPVEKSDESKHDPSKKDGNDEGTAAKTKTLTDQKSEDMEKAAPENEVEQEDNHNGEADEEDGKGVPFNFGCD